MGAAIGTLVDLCIAAAVVVAFLVALPLLTLCSGLLMKFLGSKRSRRDATAVADTVDDGSRRFDASEADSGDSASGDLFLFLIKGFVLLLLLLQGSTQLGGPIAAWAGVRVLERAARQRDRSLQLLLEPSLGPLDFLFLFGVAPLLAASVGGLHEDFATVGWHVYLCLAFFWRSPRSSSAAALSLTVGSLALFVYIGVFRWRQYVRALGLTPASEDPSDGAILLLSTASLLLVPRGSRPVAVLFACAFSDTFRQLARDMSTASVNAALGSVAMLPLPRALLPPLGLASLQPLLVSDGSSSS